MSSRKSDRKTVEEQLDELHPKLGWQPPRELRIDPLPKWPTDVLPPWAEDYARELARVMSVPIEIVVGFMLAAISAACGGRLRVSPWQDWIESVVLYLAVCVQSGWKKSPVFKPVMGPIFEEEKRRREDAGPRVAEALAAREMDEKRLEALKKAAAAPPTRAKPKKAETEDEDDTTEAKSPPSAKTEPGETLRQQAINLAQELAARRVPVLPRLVCADASPEATVDLLARHDERMAMLSPDAALFGHVLEGRYNDNPAIEGVLSAHAAEYCSVDRIGRGAITLNAPTLTIGVGIQPAVITKAREKDARGFCARFFWVTADGTPGYEDTSEPEPIDPLVSEAYEDGIRRLFRDVFDLERPSTLHLDPNARPAFSAMRDQINLYRREGGRLEVLPAWGNKLDGLLLRLTGLLHVAWGHGLDEDVSEETLHRAWALVEAAVSHVRRVLLDPPADDETMKHARKLRAWILDGSGEEMRERFKTADAHQVLHHTADARQTEAAITVLVRHDIVQPLGPVEGQRSDTKWWAVNPALFRESQTVEVRPHARAMGASAIAIRLTPEQDQASIESFMRAGGLRP